MKLEEYATFDDLTIHELNTIDGSKPSLLEALESCGSIVKEDTKYQLTRHIPDLLLNEQSCRPHTATSRNVRCQRR